MLLMLAAMLIVLFCMVIDSNITNNNKAHLPKQQRQTHLSITKTKIQHLHQHFPRITTITIHQRHHHNTATTTEH
ncbi:hypothetical protein E2C01_067828 [Portunus trituberculatus]|uniref:Secreted protein n=1 Tax=Portunus trituberculatus TaxID=210409 RepID=A0A5B7HUV9_PORTR|nr:hypothetical protein [Portunus trituberculatus]